MCPGAAGSWPAPGFVRRSRRRRAGAAWTPAHPRAASPTCCCGAGPRMSSRRTSATASWPGPATDPRVTALDRVNVREPAAGAGGAAARPGHGGPVVHLAGPGAACAGRVRGAGCRLRAAGEAAVRGRQGQGRRGRGGTGSAAAGGVRRGRGRGRGRGRAGRPRGHREPAARAVGQCGVLPVAAPGAPPLDPRPCSRPSWRARSDRGQRTMLVVAPYRAPRRACGIARLVVSRLTAAGIGVRVLESEAAELGLPAATVVPVSPAAAAAPRWCWSSAATAPCCGRRSWPGRPASPLLGVNLGRVGFLAEAEPEDLADGRRQVVAREYAVEERMTIDVTAG